MDLPFEHNRVTLDPDLRGDDCAPAPRVTYRYDEGMHRLQKLMRQKAMTSMRRAGAYETRVVSSRP